MMYDMRTDYVFLFLLDMFVYLFAALAIVHATITNIFNALITHGKHLKFTLT